MEPVPPYVLKSMKLSKTTDFSVTFFPSEWWVQILTSWSIAFSLLIFLPVTLIPHVSYNLMLQERVVTAITTSTCRPGTPFISKHRDKDFTHSSNSMHFQLYALLDFLRERQFDIVSCVTAGLL